MLKSTLSSRNRGVTNRVKYYQLSRTICPANRGVKSLGVTLPLPALTNSQPATDRTDFPSFSPSCCPYLASVRVCGCVNREQREFPPDCDSLLLWLTRVLTKTVRRHGDADCRPLATVLEAAASVAKCAVSPLPLQKTVGLGLSGNWEGFVVKTWQPWRQLQFTDKR